MELRENRNEREHLLKRIDGHRHASESVSRTNHESAKSTRYSDQPAGWHGGRDWQATPVTSPVLPQAQPFFAEPSHFGSNAWNIGQLPPQLPSSSFPNSGPWMPSSPFPSSGASYSGMNQPPPSGTLSHQVKIRKLDRRRHLECRCGTGKTIGVITAGKEVTGKPNVLTGSNDRWLKEQAHKGQVREPIWEFR